MRGYGVAMRGMMVAALVAATGCLSSPSPAPGRDGGGGRDATPLVDALPTACGHPSDYTARSFPNDTGHDIKIRAVIADDINRDGYTDLIVSNANPADFDGAGVFVLLGPQSNPHDLKYHAYISTSVLPRALAVRDVMGTGCKDISVFGPNNTGSTGFIEVYENTAVPTMFSNGPARKDVEFLPQGSVTPVMLTYGDFSGNGHGNDIVVSDLYSMRLLFTGSFAHTGTYFEPALLSAFPTDIGPSGSGGGWSGVNGVLTYRSVAAGADSDDLVVVEQTDITWLKNNGSGTFADPINLSSSGVFSSLSVKQIDFDGNEPIDVFTGGGTGFGVFQLTAGIETVEVKALGSNLSNAMLYDDLNDIVVGDLDGNQLPEVILIEKDDTGDQPGRALLIENVYEQAGELRPQTVTPFSFESEGVEPTLGIYTDFNGDSKSEVWVISDAGDTLCLEGGTLGSGLQYCQ